MSSQSCWIQEDEQLGLPPFFSITNLSGSLLILSCIGIGVGGLHFVEKLGWLDAFYLSVMSVTTAGYGDRAFKTLPGRIFASIWLLVSTLAVARAFLYLAEARVDKRHRKMVKWVLGQDMNVSEFLAADIDNNGFVSKSEYVMYKLKETCCRSARSLTDLMLATVEK